MSLPRVQSAIVQQLHSSGSLSPEQRDKLLSTEEDLSGLQLEQILTEQYKVTSVQLLVAKSKAFEMTPVNVRAIALADDTFKSLEPEFCEEHDVFPLGVIGNHFVVAVTDPFNHGALQRIGELTRLAVLPMLALETDLAKKFDSVRSKQQAPTPVGFGDVMETLNIEFSGEDGEEITEDDLEEESSPIVQLAARVIEECYYEGGSDIHIEPFENDARVRLRVDGVCQEKLRLPKKVCATLMARLKVMANLDIAEKRLPQDGRIVYKQFNRKGIDVDLRVSTAPLNHGEGAVMRILDKQKSTLPLTALGFSEKNLKVYRELIERPYGMILHCGPTGSGKSMTLYSALNEINSPDVCIRTAEDPIEYTLPGLLQMQMNRKIGLTFAAALRSFLRQDPDIILVGEIRDRETAGIAVEAALTGHMLFSTLHTNDAPSTVSRLTEMEIEPFMISASLVCVCAQRLLRRVCKTCRQVYEPEGRELEILNRAIGEVGKIYRANPDGCPACKGVGYKGRVGIHELMQTSSELIYGINQGFETAKLKKLAVRGGMWTLHQDSLLKVKEGISTVEESLANVPPDIEDLRKVMAAATVEEALAD
jgi:type IV pilus assembly protein PilB